MTETGWTPGWIGERTTLPAGREDASPRPTAGVVKSAGMIGGRTLAAAALGVAIAAAAWPRAGAAGTPDDVFKRLSSAREVRVEIKRYEERPAPFVSQRPSGYLDQIPLIDKRLDERWVPVLLNALGGREALRPAATTTPPCAADSTSEQTAVWFHFGGKRGLAVRAWLERGVAWLMEPEGAREHLFVFGDGAKEVVRVVRIALGNEGILSGQRLCDAAAADSGATRALAVYVDELPEALWKAPPDYPDEARRSGVAGEVLVEAFVSSSGQVERTRIIRSIPMLDAAAARAVERWTFKPARSGGRAIPVWVTIPIRFSQY